MKTLQKIIVNELNDTFPNMNFSEEDMYTDDEMGASVEFGEVTVDEILKIRDIIDKYDCTLECIFASLTPYDDAELYFTFVKKPQ